MATQLTEQTGSPGCSLKDRRHAFMELVGQLEMKHYLSSKVTLSDILSIGSESQEVIEPRSLNNLPWHFLRKLMAVNWTARNTQLQIDPINQEPNDNVDDDDIFFDDEHDNSYTIHPLDIQCILMHCSDSFLQQESMSKMAMCQFAVPLLLPAGEGLNSTLMLWAMRDIVKKWRPESLVDSKGFKEDNVVNISMPIFSFVKLGKNKLSKSKILNQILNPMQQHHDFFIHDDMEGGNIKRKVADGLVEVSWYFPNGHSDVFPEPITVTNLRGDLESNQDQFTFLTRVSSAVFIFVESISEKQFTLLSSFGNSDTQYYFIFLPCSGKEQDQETKIFLKQLMRTLDVDNNQILVKRTKSNDAEFVKKIQNMLGSLLEKNLKKTSIENMKTGVQELQIDVDENFPECQKARAFARNITSTIRDVGKYKKEALKLQGDLWKQLSKVEKERCRMANQGDKSTENYLSELREQRISLHRQQHQHDLPEAIMLFINGITHLSRVERNYFLKWMKIELDDIARTNLSALQLEYKEKCCSNNPDELKQVDQKISDSSLGVEHFLRELGQFYEAECSLIKENIIKTENAQFSELPGIAADLLLDGFPLELIDGDASNIPLIWISDVLTQLNIKMQSKNNKIQVITVLGVQSTGKSTLLNTMFGLQFPVASGRCTRGAFMTVLKVKENLQEELGCKLILVIDTEGLKAPELASLEGSYEHDNELATVVVGLSDITIVNMAMENTSEMKDILQIVVHAFLRMKETGKKNSCQFVHQNVSDVSAHEKNMRDRKKLLEHLDEMTKVAAKMEKKSGIECFSDVMDYNLENNNWYIPGLWQGVPPMAPVSFGYSENVHKLKQHLLNLMKSQPAHYSIEEFIKWIESLWEAVKHEKFIFNFRNSLVAEAYNKLTMQFSLWEWEFSKTVHKFLVGTENEIKNQSQEHLDTEMCEQYRRDIIQLISQEENKMQDLLKNYFESNSGNVHLVERYREDFTNSVHFLRKELERNALNNCNKAITIQKGLFEIQTLQSQYQQMIEDKIGKLLETNCKNSKLSVNEIRCAFESMWKETLTGLQLKKLDRRKVGQAILHQLRNDMSSEGSDVQQKLNCINNLESSECHSFKMNKKFIDNSWWNRLRNKFTSDNFTRRIEDFAVSIISKCNRYIQEMFDTNEDYDVTYCQEILRMIDQEIESAADLPLTKLFELEIKHIICAKAARTFQKMHDRFIEKNDPITLLESLKPQYLSTFLSIFHEKDESQTRARQFCERCLQPAITDYIFKHLGEKIVDDILHSSDSKIFSSRSFFHCHILENLLKEMSFQKYVDFIQSHQTYTETWILNYISKKYKSSGLNDLYLKILSTIKAQIQDVLKEKRSLESPDIKSFLKNVCERLQKELIISQNEINVITFHNKADVATFSSDIQRLLVETEQQIQSELEKLNTDTVISSLKLKPQQELFRKVVGCGKQCPFCKVPCEAGGGDHTEHFASVHKSQGLGTYRWTNDETLVIDICSSLVISNTQFKCPETKWAWHPYKNYKAIFPDWAIQPDPGTESSDYWKYIFAQFNGRFATEYRAKPAKIPNDWQNISQDQALASIKKVFNVK